MGLDVISDFTIDRRLTPADPASRAVLNLRGANIQAAAAHNRKIILQSLRVLKTAERSDLADITGLTAPAVSKIVKDLLREGLVISPASRQGAKGQPAAVLAVNPDAAFSLGVSLEPDRLVVAVVDFAGVVRGYRSLSGRPGLPALRRFFSDSVEACFGGQAPDPSKIAGIGMAAGALPDGRSDLVGMALISLFGRPSGVEDLVVAAAHAEAVLGQAAGPETEPFFYFHLGEPLSGALVIDRQVVRASGPRRGAPAALPQLNPFRSSRTDLGKTLGDAVSVPAFLGFLAERGLKAPALDDVEWADAAVGEAADEWVEAVADLLYLPMLSMFCCLNLSSVRIGGPLPPVLLDRLCRGLSARLSLNLGLDWPDMAVKPGALGVAAPAAGAALLAFDDKWDISR